MFVTSSNFNVPPYKLPSGSTAEEETFDAFIDQEERKYLLEVLGDNLYTAFIDGLEALPGAWSSTVATVIGQQYVYGNDIWEALTVQTGTAPVAGSDWTLIEEGNRWLLLKNGNYYMMDGKRYYWDGMVNALKALIFANWVEYNSSALTSNGLVVPKHENNISVDPGQIICRAWNDWAKHVGGPCRLCNTLYGYLYFENLDNETFNDVISPYTSFIEYLNYQFTTQSDGRNPFDI